MTKRKLDDTIGDFFCRSSPAIVSRIGAAVLVLSVVGGVAACHRSHALQNTTGNQAPKASACRVTEEDAADLNGDVSVNVLSVHDYTTTISRMFKEEKFDELDCLAARARSNKERFSGGTWKLHQLYQAVSDPAPYQHSTEEDWGLLLQRLQRWTAARPQSITARVALAKAYIGYAADLRGDGAENTVSESGWKLIAERTAQAEKILQEAAALPEKSPEWYVAMLEVAENQKWDEARKSAMFAKAIKFEPGYYYYGMVLTNRLLPKFGTNPGEMEKFSQEIADRIGGEQGDIQYFQIAMDSIPTCGCNTDYRHLDLKRIEQGFEASEKRFGVSLVNLNRMAFLAARTPPQDDIFAAQMFARVGDQWDEDTWRWKDDFDVAKNAAVFFAGRLSIEAAANANMKTPEGLRYRAAFEKPYRALVQECMRQGDGDYGKFKALTNVGTLGTVEDVRIYGNNPPASCLYGKLHQLQQEKSTAFPVPPHASYWVMLDLNWAEFAPVAAK